MKKIIIQLPLFFIALMSLAQGQQQVPDAAGKVPVKQGAQMRSSAAIVKMPVKQGSLAALAGVSSLKPRTLPIKTANGQEKVDKPAMLAAPLRSSDNNANSANNPSSANNLNNPSSANDAKKP